MQRIILSLEAAHLRRYQSQHWLPPGKLWSSPHSEWSSPHTGDSVSAGSLGGTQPELSRNIQRSRGPCPGLLLHQLKRYYYVDMMIWWQENSFQKKIWFSQKNIQWRKVRAKCNKSWKASQIKWYILPEKGSLSTANSASSIASLFLPRWW